MLRIGLLQCPLKPAVVRLTVYSKVDMGKDDLTPIFDEDYSSEIEISSFDWLITSYFPFKQPFPFTSQTWKWILFLLNPSINYKTPKQITTIVTDRPENGIAADIIQIFRNCNTN